MMVDTNPYRSLNANITAQDFEIFCMETLKAYGVRENLPNFTVKHNQKVEAYDGTYQIDVLAEFTALGTELKVFAECKKRESRSIERDEASDLYTKVKSAGAHKGVLISTTGFQSGTVQFAKAHGIALWQICDSSVRHITNSGSKSLTDEMKFQLHTEQYLPRYFMLEWDCDMDYPCDQIYPTEEMRKAAMEKAIKSYPVKIAFDPKNAKR